MLEYSVDLNLDFHQKSSLCSLGGPYSPASYSVGTSPSFMSSVRNDLFVSPTENSLMDTYERAYETLLSELGRGHIFTFDEVASFVNRQVSRFDPGLYQYLNSPNFPRRCRGAQAIYNSRKVSWLLDQIRRGAHDPVLSFGGEGEAATPEATLTNVDPRWLHTLNGLPYAPALPTNARIAPNTAQVNPRPKKRQRKESRQSPAPEGMAPPRISKCHLCDQPFSGTASDRKSNMKRHIEHKHPGSGQARAHVCPECDGTFGRSDYLLDHRRRAHDVR
jgi:hypothetical protein